MSNSPLTGVGIVIITTPVRRLYQRLAGHQNLANAAACNQMYSESEPVDFTVRLANSVPNLPGGQVKFYDEFSYRRTVIDNHVHQKHFFQIS